MGLALLVAIDVVVVVALSVLVGAWAPRWPDRWLMAGPLPRLPWETPPFFRRLRVARWARRIPELGGAFGGQPKDRIPGHTPRELRAYLIEVRRAEWVHWGSILGSLTLFAFNPWWLAAVFVLVVTVGNSLFLIVLRNNRFRIERILDKATQLGSGNA